MAYGDTPGNIYQLPKRDTLPLLHKFNIYNIIYIYYILGYILHTLTPSLISVTDICYRELPSEKFFLCINELRV